VFYFTMATTGSTPVCFLLECSREQFDGDVGVAARNTIKYLYHRLREGHCVKSEQVAGSEFDNHNFLIMSIPGTNGFRIFHIPANCCTKACAVAMYHRTHGVPVVTSISTKAKAFFQAFSTEHAHRATGMPPAAPG
jgi:hypothetical protein